MVALAITLLIGSCSNQRLDQEGWEETWRQTVARVEEAEAAVIPEQRCQELLAFLRTQRDLLDPPPLERLDVPVDTWFEIAEASFFDCPPRGEEVDGWPAAFAELDVIEEEVEAVLKSKG